MVGSDLKLASLVVVLIECDYGQAGKFGGLIQDKIDYVQDFLNYFRRAVALKAGSTRLPVQALNLINH